MSAYVCGWHNILRLEVGASTPHHELEGRSLSSIKESHHRLVCLSIRMSICMTCCTSPVPGLAGLLLGGAAGCARLTCPSTHSGRCGDAALGFPVVVSLMAGPSAQVPGSGSPCASKLLRCATACLWMVRSCIGSPPPLEDDLAIMRAAGAAGSALAPCGSRPRRGPPLSCFWFPGWSPSPAGFCFPFRSSP